MKNLFVKQALISVGGVRVLFTILSLVFFIIGCSSTKEVKKPPTVMTTEVPSFKIGKTTLAKGILDIGSEGTPLNPATTFTALDKEVIAHIKLKNVSGKHKIRWDWYTPEGGLYYSTGNSVIGAKKGKYIREMSLWHKISLKNDKAEFLPGIWHVDISFDDALVSSNKFKLIVEKDGIYVDTLSIATVRPNPNNWGFIVGIEKYAKLPSVEYARKDASIVKEYFEKILGIPKENIISLLDSEATKSKIESYIKSYLPLNVNKNTTLYVYFAGHGTPSIDKGEAYLVPYDSEPRFISHTGYNLKSLYEDISALKVKMAFVFIDGCFSGVAARGKKMLLRGARPTLIHVKDIRLKTKKVVSLTASTGEQISNSYPEKEHGLFTYFLLKGLRGPADLNADRKISSQELYKYVKSNVNKVSRGKGIEQTPVMLPAPSSDNKVTVSMVPR